MHRRVAACSLLAACGLFPNLSGLSGDAGSADVSSPDVTTDAAPSHDAAPDAPGDVGPDAPPPGFCATHTGHTFCEDFDEPSFAARWTGVSTSSSAVTLAESDAGWVSPPNELLASTPFPASSGAPYAFAFEHFATAKSIKVQVELFVSTGSLQEIDPLLIAFNPPPVGYSYYDIHIDSGDGHLGYNFTPEGGTNSNTDLSFVTPLDAWHAFEVDVDLNTSAVQIFVDGVSTLDATLAEPLSPTAFDLQLGVVRGLAGATATTGVVQVDNVLVDTQ